MSYFSLHVRAFVRGKGRQVQQSGLIKETISALSRPHKRKRPECPIWEATSKAMLSFNFCLMTIHGPAPPAFLFPCTTVPLPTQSQIPLHYFKNSTWATWEQPSCLKQTIISLPTHLATCILCYLPPTKCPLSTLPVERPSTCQGPVLQSFSLWNLKSPQQVSIFSFGVEFVALITWHIPIHFVSVLLIYGSWIINKYPDVKNYLI